MITSFGFSAQQTSAIIALLDSGSGKYVCSSTHRILRNRNWLVISPLQTREAANVLVETGDAEVVYERGELRLQRLPLSNVPAEIADTSSAFLDAADLQCLLLLRNCTD